MNLINLNFHLYEHGSGMQHSIWYHHDVEPLSLQFVCNQPGNHGVAQTTKLNSLCSELAIGSVGTSTKFGHGDLSSNHTFTSSACLQPSEPQSKGMVVK